MIELFKQSPYSNYRVSNCGNVKSLYTNKIRVGALDKYGYRNIVLFKNGKRKHWFVHRLVLETFIGKSNKQVNHKNGNKTDNRLDNLEYVTQSENMKHSYKNGFHTPMNRENAIKYAAMRITRGNRFSKRKNK